MQSLKSNVLVTNPEGQVGKSFRCTSPFFNMQGIYQAKIYSILLLLEDINNNISMGEL